MIFAFREGSGYQMKGFVPTPTEVVDLMVQKLFSERFPRPTDKLLDPGCGRGAFIDGVIRWCAGNGHPLPRILGVDSDANHCEYSRAKFAGVAQVEIRNDDFLAPTSGRAFDFIVGNPPFCVTSRYIGQWLYYHDTGCSPTIDPIGFGHGTGVASLVAGTKWGVAKAATIHPIRVNDNEGDAYCSDVGSGLLWVAANAIMPAVVNLSLSGECFIARRD